jgi:hypothetical protein
VAFERAGAVIEPNFKIYFSVSRAVKVWAMCGGRRVVSAELRSPGENFEFCFFPKGPGNTGERGFARREGKV